MASRGRGLTEGRRSLLAALLLALAFAIDLALPRGLAGGVLYVPVVLLGLGSRRIAFTIWLAVAAATVSAAGFLLSPQLPITFSLIWFNRVFAQMGVIVVAVAVISQQRAEARLRGSAGALRASDERFRVAFEEAPTGMAIATPTGQYLKVNRAFCEMVGRPECDIVGHDFEGIVHPEDLAALQTHMETTDRIREDIRFLHSGGGIVWGDVTLSTVRDRAGDPLYLIAQMHDVTAAKQAEEKHARLEEQLLRSQRMEAVGRLAGGVAHDFNNMLSIVLNYAMLAERRLGPTHPVVKDLVAIRDAAGRAAALTRQLLVFSGRHPTTSERIPIDEAVQELATLLRRTIGEDVDLVVDAHADDCAVAVGTTHLEQVLMNLAVNARDAMPRGGRLTIRTACLDLAADETPKAPGRYVQISVVDTGTGMTPEVKARLFEPFFTTKERGRGTGLGLAIAYGIVDAAGGWIDVDSEPGKGTTFWIQLPAEPATPQAPTPTPPRRRAATAANGEWVMVVEDEPALRDLTARILRGRGYQVLVADDGLDALEKLRAHEGPLDLLLTDVVMPRMSGRDLAARVESLRPGTVVLFVSGHADERIAKDVLYPSADLLSKPFHVDELLERVRDALDRRRPEPAAEAPEPPV